MTVLETIDAGLLIEVHEGPRQTLFKHDGQTRVLRNFYGDRRDRYDYDFKLCKRADGWCQYDTGQDAWYFGVWYHPERRVTVTWAEGDESITVCATAEAFKAELAEMAEFYGEPPPAAIALNLDTGTETHYFDPNARPDLDTIA